MTCPTCGAGSDVLLLTDLAARFDDGRRRTRQALLERAVRIAADLGVAVHTTDRTRWVSEVEVSAAIARKRGAAA